MPRIEVQPEQLHTTAGAAATLAGELSEVRAQVLQFGRQAADAAGEPAAAAAASGCGQAWSAAAGDLSSAVARLGSNADAAGISYAATDANAIP
jgi:hypothetical protein